MVSGSLSIPCMWGYQNGVHKEASTIFRSLKVSCLCMQAPWGAGPGLISRASRLAASQQLGEAAQPERQAEALKQVELALTCVHRQCFCSTVSFIISNVSKSKGRQGVGKGTKTGGSRSTHPKCSVCAMTECIGNGAFGERWRR